MKALRAAAAALFVIGAGNTAFAQLDWAVISTTGDPDPVTAFDLNNPGVSNVVIGNVDGNFNRGMDFYSYNAFYYYVSTDSLNQPGDRGLWRWDNNVNTQLFNTPFNDAGDGDATLNPAATRLYVTTDDGDATAGDSLYAFDNLNGAVTFTEIGETGLTQLFGLAMNPITGVMYAVNGGDDSLYTLDPATAAPTLIGAVGVPLGAIGGMDFSADGQTLVMSNAGALYKIDTTTGLGTFIGDTTLNDSAISARIPEPSSLSLLAAAGIFGLRRRRGT